MAWCEPEVVCMKHPNHKQQPGVCSCCLRERLSKLSGHPPLTMVVSSSISSHNDSNISSPPYNNYSSETSSSTSPSHHRRRHHRVASDVLISFSFVNSNGSNDGLKKSRSIAFAATSHGRDGVKGKKKQGFWSRLLKYKGKRTKESAGLHVS